jgi:preprotein translocase subunit SecY
LIFVLELAAFFGVTMICILIVQGVRRIPIQFAKRMVGRGNANIPQSGNRDYIPLKVNAAGVMPIIFAQAIIFLPITVAQYLMGSNGQGGTGGFLATLQDPFSTATAIFSFIMVVAFTYIYTALVVNPQQYAEYLKRQNAFIPGIKPGKETADFIDTITTRVTLPGALFLGLITVLPKVAFHLGVNQGFALFFGGTSLLILVGVVLDTMAQIESYLLMRKYDGLVKSGKLKGRSGSGMQIGANM